MPHDPVLVGQKFVEKSGFGGHDSLLLKKYEAPASGDGGIAYDEFEGYDEYCAKGMMILLNQTYSSYIGFWATRHDMAQKIAGISMPVLMGIDNWMVINRRTHDLTPGIIIASGGEILERYGLSRVRLNLGAFLDARNKHSALTVKSRKVPV